MSALDCHGCNGHGADEDGANCLRCKGSGIEPDAVCAGCGEPWTVVAICCSTASTADGLHEDGRCVDCCGNPHPRPHPPTHRATLWIAELDTSHFSFRAVGYSEQAARDRMARAWTIHRARAHANGLRCEPFSYFADDVRVWEASDEVATCDGSPL